MKMFYLMSDGVAFVEEIKPVKRLIEVKSGDYHPMVSAAVKRDETRKFPPMMFIWQNIRWAEGAQGSVGTFPALEASKAVEHMQPVSISKRWYRALLKWAWFFFKMVIVGFVLAFAVYVTTLVVRVIM